MNNINTTPKHAPATFRHFDDTPAYALALVRKPASWERGGRTTNPLPAVNVRGGASITKLRAIVDATGDGGSTLRGRISRTAWLMRKSLRAARNAI